VYSSGVASELGRERVDTVDRTPVPPRFHLLARGGGDALGGVVHAADRVDDPDLVADADAPVGAAKPVEGRVGWNRQLAQVNLVLRGVEVVAQRAGKVVRVDVLAGRDVPRR